MPANWPSLPFEEWRATCDTLHLHAQVLGKLAVALAPPEPELQHAALRLTARGWQTLPLPAPNGSCAFGVVLDLHAHETVVETSDGRAARIPLTPNRSVGSVTRDVLTAVGELAGEVEINLAPSEVPWTARLDEDEEHATYDPGQVATYLEAATRAALVLAEVPGPLPRAQDAGQRLVGLLRPRGQHLLGASGRPAVAGLHHAERDGRAGGRPRLVAGRHPLPEARVLRLRPPGSRPASRALHSSPARWDGSLGEYLLDWDDVIAAPDPHAVAGGFLLDAVRHACAVCAWDPELAASVDADPVT